jgi:glycosyltransferase involved in cell wall biosynthesis
MLRVTQIGNASRGPGGVASVVRVISSWSGPDLQVREWPTYWHGRRGRSLLLFGRSLLHVMWSRVHAADVWHFHLTQRGSFLREGLLLLLARRRGVRCTVSIHGSDFVSFVERHGQLVDRVLRSASVIFVLTDAAREVLRPMGLTVVRVNNAVPVDDDPRPTTRSGFVFAGEVGRRKGVDTLLAAWDAAHVGEHELTVLGGLEPGFVLPSRLPRGAVVVGPVEPREVLARLRTAVALVLPSRAEAMPMTILEAMSVGTPVIASDVGQVAEVVGEAGLVVPPDDPAALAGAMGSLAASPRLAEQLGRAARQRVADRYSTAAVRAVFVSHWETCSGRRHLPKR